MDPPEICVQDTDGHDIYAGDTTCINNHQHNGGVTYTDTCTVTRDTTDLVHHFGDGPGDGVEIHPGEGSGQGVKDKYTEGIEVSNACRRFYVTRVRTGEGMKERLKETPPSLGYPPLDTAMVTLRKEMAKLMEQDLTLMRQLLTLNEQIEELKWQRKMSGYSRSAEFSVTSCHVDSSTCVLHSEADCACAGSREALHYKYPTPSKLSLLEETDACGEEFSSHTTLYSSYTTPYQNSSGRATSSCAGRADVSGASSGFVNTSRSRDSTSDLGSYDELVPGVHNGSVCTGSFSHGIVPEIPWGGRRGTDSAYSTCDDASCRDGVRKVRQESEGQIKDNVMTSTQNSQGQQSFDSGIQVPSP